MQFGDRLASALGNAYTLERELGAGGMARVFLAQEKRFGRRVVVKVLTTEVSAGLSAARFEREIGLTAALQQANIVPIIAAGDDGELLWYTMPYVEGETLPARLTRGPLEVREAVKILSDVARALSYAHEHGVVHRDIKPANVLLSGGTAVVTDFGIAKAIVAATARAERPEAGGARAQGEGEMSDLPGSTLTAVGMTLGTPAYMAPEQVIGGDVDRRADLYAWGVMAYELLAGTHPFGQRITAQQLAAAHVGEAAPPLRTTAPGTPPVLAALVMRCLEKDPERRPGSAAELLQMLESSTTQIVSGRGTSSAARIALAAVVLLTLGVAAWQLAGPRGLLFSNATASSTIAVLPFANLGGDSAQQYFADGLADELTTALARIPGLQVASQSAAFQPKVRAMNAQQAGRVLGVATVLEGSVRRAGARIRFTARLVDVDKGLSVWSDAFEHEGDDTFAAQDDFTRRVASALHDRLSVVPASTQLARGTDDRAAYDLYLRARYLFLRRGAMNLGSAATLFAEAIRRDSAFARAYAGLAMVQVVLPEYDPQPADTLVPAGLRNAERAIALDSTAADAWVALGYGRLQKWDWLGSETAFRRAIDLEPSSLTAHEWYGDMLFAAGRLPEALEHNRHAAELDPAAAVIASEATAFLLMLRRYPEAIEEGRRALALDSLLPFPYVILGRVYLALGQSDSASALLERGRRANEARPHQWQVVNALALAASGRRDEALRAAAALESDAEQGRAYAYVAAVLYAGLGDYERAVGWLTRSIEAREAEATNAGMACEPLFDPLRSDARFIALLQQAGLRTCATVPGSRNAADR